MLRRNLIFFISTIFSLTFFAPAYANPHIANYYLGVLEDTPAFISSIARYHALILTPAQIARGEHILKKIKKQNANMTIFAYVPSQSYNTIFWPADPVFRNVRVEDDWWLTDSNGRPIDNQWPGIKHIAMTEEWRTYWLSFIQDHILSLPHVDGIFFDMVTENISWLNQGAIDFNRDGVIDAASAADALWKSRMHAFLSEAAETLNTNAIVINGTSDPAFQPSVNGRMFETFPTPWEGDGRWATVMNSIRTTQKDHRAPRMIILNGNTDNTGIENLQKVRFGLTSTLLENDLYFSYDFGDRHHGQLWWYDEYNVKLGKPLSSARAATPQDAYAPDIWRRDFENGVSIVNSKNETAIVPLNGEFEKIRGTQDKKVNDGSIVSEVTVAGEDGLILLKTFESLDDILFTNGDFARLLRPDGAKVRNGFFVFEDNRKGSDQIAHVDLDRNGERDLVVVSGPKITVWRDDGQVFMKEYPYTVNYKGTLRVAIGDLNGDEKLEVYVAPSEGKHPIKIYTRHGRQMKQDWFPFGPSYAGGYSIAIARLNPSEEQNHLIVGAGTGMKPLVQIYDSEYNKIREWLGFESSFKGGLRIAAGDLDHNGVDEIIIGPGKGKAPIIRVFDIDGASLYPEFIAYQSNNLSGISAIQSRDVDFDGREDIVVMSGL